MDSKYMVDPANETDTTSLSNCGEVQPASLAIKWALDFEKRTLAGSVEYTFSEIGSGVTKVCFDNSALDISGVEIDGKKTDWKVHAPHKALGSKLEVGLVPGSGKKKGGTKVKIFYSTAPTASAIQWADAAATADKKRPYVYTQCQAIHARSLMPCMDSPGIKMPYTAEVIAPEWCTVLMSALGDGDKANKDGTKTFKFNQPVPTPAYLVALVGGLIESRDISKRCRVWSEPSMVDRAAFDFSQTEDFLQAAESLTMPYMWTRYDVLCLPPSFPYGGMENPCLTFVTPTLLTGDKSLADVVAHEIAHSWTGNLVTNKTWNHFFLNEGWTMWLQRKIEQKIKGGKDHFMLSAQSGWTHLKDDIALFGADHPFTCLVCPLGDDDPDDSFSSVPYEKGFNLLYRLECIVGSTEFEAFAKAYLDNFKYSTVTSDKFRKFFLKHFAKASKEVALKISELDWNELFHAPGMPKFTPDFTNSLSKASSQLGHKWISDGGKGASKADMQGWSVQQVLLFQDALLEHANLWGPFSETTLLAIDKAYEFTSSTNSEIKFKWQTLCIKSEVEWILPHVISFVTSAGRMKFVRPLYRSLGNSKMGRELAIKTFAEHETMYHPIARKMVKSDLAKLSGGSGGGGVFSKGLALSAAMTAAFFAAATMK